MSSVAMISCVPVPSEDDLDPREYSLTLCIRLGADKAPDPLGHSFGCWGTPTRNEAVCPFILYEDGSIDFGDYETDADRFGGTDLLDLNEIKVGARFVFTASDGDYQYAIKTISLLAGDKI